jgi:hypothetical protein
MPVIQRLLERWGFIKLRRYGLARTPDGRILSMRSTILDDGAGGRIVGWQDDDLAMAELEPWEPSARRVPAHSPAAPRFVPGLATRAEAPEVTTPALAAHVHAQPSTAAAAPTVPATAAAAPTPAAPPPAAPTGLASAWPGPASTAVLTPGSVLEPPAAAPTPAMPVEVAAEAPVDDDEWEWIIALARARAEEPPRVPRSPLSRTRPMATVAAKDPAASGEWPKTEPIGAIDYDRISTRPAIAIPQGEASTQRTAPVTVIPVPVLPTLQGSQGRLQPVVRAVPPASSSRFAKGTAPVDPDAERAAAMSDDTDPNVSIGDRTTPGIAMPPVARAVTLPSIKRRTSTS